ncbi:MAG: hypothetical protein QOD26_1447 [Betaproteobacteria bacterium]|jgi:hypothetical protein|nr:hypothetical protein [Betaproteobacteria bacterium]
MRYDYTELHAAARRHRARVIATLFATAIAWLISRKPRVAHAARPHFAR